MKTVYSPVQERQNAAVEYIRGRQVPSFENARRAQMILERLHQVALGPVLDARPFGTAPMLAAHDAEMIAFLQKAWDWWSAENGPIDAFPNTWPAPRARRLPIRRPGPMLGAYCTDMSSPILAGTWDAIQAGSDTALTALEIAEGPERMAFALCRPPGHHAGRDYFGGYCFINNAAIAAQAFLVRGAGKVAVLDVDYHHGNGTQDIFYDRPEVLTVSLHADPADEYRYYSGYADETGAGAGEGCNLNLPMPWGSDYGVYARSLAQALERIAAHGSRRLVVSLGVDTFKDDPISRFRLDSPDYLAMGKAIAGLGLPTLFVMEGGYAVEALGINAVNVLTGFAGG